MQIVSQRHEETTLIIVGFTIVLLITTIYCLKTGLIVFMGDSYLLADRAKHLVYEGTLNSEQYIIYPPLYPLFVSPAYFFLRPEITHKVILALNALIYASAFFPIRLLLKNYSGLKQNGNIIIGVLLTVAPFSMPYASMYLYDALSYPVFLWFCVFVDNLLRNRSSKDFFLAGIFLAISVLVKESLKILVASFVVVSAIDIVQSKLNTSKSAVVFKKYFYAFFAFLMIYSAWFLIERFFIIYPSARFSYLTWVAKLSEIDLRFSWFSNIFFYYLTAPLSAAAIFTMLFIIFRPRLLLEDLFILFSLLCGLGAWLSPVLLMPSSYGGVDLTWNRYQSLYVLLFILIALRYFRLLDFNFFKSISVLLILLLFIGIPAKLECHFPDSLVFFMKTSNLLKLPSIILDVLYFLVAIIPISLLLNGKRWAKKTAVAFLFIVYLAGDGAAYLYWSQPGGLHLESYKGICQIVTDRYFKDGDISVFYDPHPDNKDISHLIIKRYHFYFPFFMKPKSLDDIKALAAKSNNELLYLTDKNIYRGGKKLAEDPTRVKLYSFSKRSESAVNEFKADLIVEATPSGMKIDGLRPSPEGPYPPSLPRIRWANSPSVKLAFENPTEMNLKRAALRMSFSPFGMSTSRMFVRFNGAPLKNYTSLELNQWRHEALALVPKSGYNIIELSFDERSSEKQVETLYMLFKTLEISGVPESRLED
ncbi:MAG: hypothetical protein ABSB22_05920 [Thermodesulfobacteriota bacterium]|jgi:hypothetical protein